MLMKMGNLKILSGKNDAEIQAKIEADIRQCFLCLQNVNFTSEINNGIEGNQWIQFILKYWCASSKDLTDQESEIYPAENHKDNDLFKLCSSCGTIIAKLSSLIRQLEVTQMWIDHQTKQLHHIFQMSENEEPDLDSQYLDVQQLRRMLKSKCKHKLTA